LAAATRIPFIGAALSKAKQFASHADTEEKQVTFEQLSKHAWACTAEGDPNTGFVIGDDAVLVADTQATTTGSPSTTACPST
jgi:hypothetical protein